MNVQIFTLFFIFLLYGVMEAIAYSFRSNNENDTQKGESFKPNKQKRSIPERNNSTFIWQLPKNYDANLPPWEYRNITNTPLPWNYHYVFSIFEIQEIDDMKRTVLLNMYFLIYWLEPRIEINEDANDWTDITKGNLSFIPLEQIGQFWQPDLDTSAVKTYDAKSVLKDMASFKVNKTKWMRYSSRVDFTITCHMNFEAYPFDDHVCPFKIGSYYDSIETVNCSSEFHFENEEQPRLNHKVKIRPLDFDDHIYHLYGQDWATCGFNIKLQRTKIQNFVGVFMTCTLLIIISWISFIIRPEIVTIQLVLINIFIGIKNKAPISSDLNAFDVFLVICIGHVFVACLEYAIVLLMMEKDGKVSPLESSIQEYCLKSRILKRESRKEKCRGTRINLDRISLVLFPIAYFLMMFIYFFVYIHN